MKLIVKINNKYELLNISTDFIIKHRSVFFDEWSCIDCHNLYTCKERSGGFRTGSYQSIRYVCNHFRVSNLGII